MNSLKQKSAEDLQKLMKISAALGDLNWQRNQDWQKQMTDQNSKQALFAFTGDVYTGLSATTLTELQVKQAQKQLRILSGLYGLLKPLDRIQPYRLEMGTKLVQGDHQNLYQFWGNQITDVLQKDIEEAGVDAVINLASQEYSKAVKFDQLSVPVITPTFLDEKNGEFKIISFFAKKARGLMVRYLLDHPDASLDDLKQFQYGGYQWIPNEDWVFQRSEKQAA